MHLPSDLELPSMHEDLDITELELLLTDQSIESSGNSRDDLWVGIFIG